MEKLHIALDKNEVLVLKEALTFTRKKLTSRMELENVVDHEIYTDRIKTIDSILYYLNPHIK